MLFDNNNLDNLLEMLSVSSIHDSKLFFDCTDLNKCMITIYANNKFFNSSIEFVFFDVFRFGWQKGNWSCSNNTVTAVTAETYKDISTDAEGDAIPKRNLISVFFETLQGDDIQIIAKLTRVTIKDL